MSLSTPPFSSRGVDRRVFDPRKGREIRNFFLVLRITAVLLCCRAAFGEEVTPTPAPTPTPAVRFYGWIQQGFTANFDSPRDRVNFGVNFNWRSNDYRLNQFYFVLENSLRARGRAKRRLSRGLRRGP